MNAGDLTTQIRFEAREDLSRNSPPGDGAGNLRGAWEPRFIRPAAIKPIKGREEILAQRLQGVTPALIVVRFDRQTAQITPEWRAVEITPEGREIVWAISAVQDMERRRQWLTLACLAGGADG